MCVWLRYFDNKFEFKYIYIYVCVWVLLIISIILQSHDKKRIVYV